MSPAEKAAGSTFYRNSILWQVTTFLHIFVYFHQAAIKFCKPKLFIAF